MTQSLHPFMICPAEAFGKPAARLGLASHVNASLTPDDVLYALERGVHFLNYAGLSEGPTEPDAFTQAIAGLGAKRADVVICAQFGARTEQDAREEWHALLEALHTDYIDVLTLYYVEEQEEWDSLRGPGGALAFCRAAKKDGTLRRIGVTSHQRPLAAEMARSGELDVLMIRYNAAHRGAERDVFPVTTELSLPVICYTATRWGALFRATPSDPIGLEIPRAPWWYRFVLDNPAVSVVLCAPHTRAELEEDLGVLSVQGPLSLADHMRLAAHGARVRQHAGQFP